MGDEWKRCRQDRDYSPQGGLRLEEQDLALNVRAREEVRSQCRTLGDSCDNYSFSIEGRHSSWQLLCIIALPAATRLLEPLLPVGPLASAFLRIFLVKSRSCFLGSMPAFTRVRLAGVGPLRWQQALLIIVTAVEK